MTPTHTGSRLAPFPAARSRRGVTLIELLVVIAIIAGLSLLALMLLPSISNSDKVLKGTEEVRATCKVAQALAAGSRQPRGVRFLVDANAPLGNRFAKEMQLLEAPPVVLLDPKALVADPQRDGQIGTNRVGLAGVANTGTAPYVELVYDLYNGSEQSVDPNYTSPPNPTPNPPAGSIKRRHCYLKNLSLEQKAQVLPGSLLVLPALGVWSRVNQTSWDASGGYRPYTLAGYTSAADEVELDFYPDTAMGASTAYRTHHAGIFGVPVPLLGQPTIPLPKDVAVDLDISSPVAMPPTTPVPNFDVMFAPDGQTMSVTKLLGNGQTAAQQSSNAGVYLWVRDITKVTNPNGAVKNSMRRQDIPTGLDYAAAFRLGGEHHAVGIVNGYVGTAPIQWPDANGTYSSGDEFTFARKRLN